MANISPDEIVITESLEIAEMICISKRASTVGKNSGRRADERARGVGLNLGTLLTQKC
jgi:hypothetical protein